MADTIAINSHGFSTGELVRLTSSGAAPGGLSSGTDYYVIKVDDNTLKLASSTANAQLGTAIDLTSIGGGTSTIYGLSSAAGPGSAGLMVSPGNGDGTLDSATAFGAGYGSTFVSLRDLNGDSKLDAIAAGATGDAIGVALGNGDGTFGAMTSYATAGTAVQSAAFGDFNADGNVDIVTADTGSNALSFFAGNGDGTFDAASGIAMGSAPENVYAGDIDDDGNLDVAAVNSDSNTVTVRYGNGDGTFQAPAAFNVGNAPAALSFADLNGDGFSEMVSALRDSGEVAVNGASITRTSSTVKKSIRGGSHIDPLAQNLRSRGQAKFALETLKKLKEDLTEDLEAITTINEALQSARTFALAGVQATEHLGTNIQNIKDAEGLAKKLAATIRQVLPSQLDEINGNLDTQLARELLL